VRKEGLTRDAVRAFQKLIYHYYQEHGRTFPWRTTHNPYHILVSEIMLQQTQTERVAEKYEQFINSFPDFSSLAKAPLREILKAWQGLEKGDRLLFEDINNGEGCTRSGRCPCLPSFPFCK